ncbi:MAG: hypothetical protein IJP44_11050 [Bacteroidales bacterium]|nr:hypothetical protein [Bacteroidales bacterium]
MKDLADAKLTPNNTHILNSYLVKSKAEMRDYLRRLRDVAAENAVNRRDMESMVREWRSHNLFYFLHVFRSRTKDVDLELNQSWPRELFCRVVDFLYFW